MRAVDRFFELYLTATGFLVKVVAALSLLIMVSVNSLEIGWRAVHGGSISWVQEFSLIVAMYLYFYCYALIAKEQDYICVGVGVHRLAAPAKRLLAILIRLLVIAFHGMILWLGLGTLKFASLFTTSVLEWPETVFYVPVVAGALDIVLTELIYLVWQLRGRPLPQVDPGHAEI